MISNYRVFVRYGEVLNMKHYYGDPLVFPDPIEIREAYTTASDAYDIDFAVTSVGETVLIEVNDAYALGCYGLGSHKYAKTLINEMGSKCGPS